jgi:hypothetical protein
MQAVVPSQVVAAVLKLFPGAKEPGELTLRSQQLPQLMAIVRLVRRVPSQLLTAPIEQYVELEQAIETIEQSLWLLSREQYQFQISTVGDTGKSVIKVIYNVLKACQDTFPASSAASLRFITDQKTRDSISREIGSVESAVRNGEWKAATVLAGAAIEALLLWRLSSFSEEETSSAVTRCLKEGSLGHRPKSNKLDWTLPEMIETSAQLSILRSNTVTEARQCKDFRNLIHPGRVLASEAECNRGTAFSAVAALDFVVSDLANQYLGSAP